MEKVYRFLLNVMPLFRGMIKYLSNLRPDYSIGKKCRIGRGARIRFHVGGHADIGNKVNIGSNTMLSVLNGGNLKIGNNVSFGTGSQIVCHGQIIIGDNTISGPNVMIYDHNHVVDPVYGVHHKDYITGRVSIGKDTWIGAGSIILNNVTIGNAVVVGAGSVVTKDIPDGCVAVGNPARVIKRL